MFTLISDEPDQHLYQYRSLLLNIHWDELKLAHLTSNTRACEQVCDVHKQMTSIILLRGAVNVDVSNEARRAGASMTSRFEKFNTGQAVVVEASGFTTEKIPTEGQSLMVQVLKDPIGTKGPHLSTQVSLAGRLLVYLPQEKHIGISQRIEDEAGREALRSRLVALVPEDEPGGFIVRTMAESATDAELAADIAYLRKLWREISGSTVGLFPPKLLHEDLGLGQRTLRDLVTDETSRIRVDSRENFQKLAAFAAEYTPQVPPLLEHYSGDRPLFELYSVEEEIQKALARRVDLKSGGYLIIDQTEAMTTVDVNTGGFVGARDFDDTIFKTNLEANPPNCIALQVATFPDYPIVDYIIGDTVHVSVPNEIDTDYRVLAIAMQEGTGPCDLRVTLELNSLQAEYLSRL